MPMFSWERIRQDLWNRYPWRQPVLNRESRLKHHIDVVFIHIESIILHIAEKGLESSIIYYWPLPDVHTCDPTTKRTDCEVFCQFQFTWFTLYPTASLWFFVTFVLFILPKQCSLKWIWIVWIMLMNCALSKIEINRMK